MLLSAISGGLYLVYWFFFTWKQYRDHTGVAVYPVWHALALLVPIYGLFRTYAHMRTYRRLLTTSQMPTTISPWPAVLMALLVGLRPLGAFELVQLLDGPPTADMVFWGFAAASMSAALVCWTVGFAQVDINSYWKALSPGTDQRFARIGLGEVLITAVGVLWFLGLLVAAASVSLPGGDLDEPPTRLWQARPISPIW